MFVFENLLRNEYIPAELPPCFNSYSFADKHEKIQNIVKDKTLKPSDPLVFSGYKNSNSRRKFAIPNAYSYAKAAHVIVINSTDIFSILNNSYDCSLTVPLSNPPLSGECYKKPVKDIFGSKGKIKKIYQNNLYEIRLDIQSFFDSVYTHSIAWAMHSKSFAKKNKHDKELSGNQIDKCIQGLNSGQTNGILIGNAISRIVSEIILCSIDKVIKSRIKGVKYIRFVDDYYVFVKDSSQINSILAIFRQELAKYELNLNENKLQIIESPFIYGKPWVEEMRIHARLEPSLLLEKAIIEYRQYKDIAILKYALKVLRGKKFSRSEWKNIEPTIISIWIRFPNLSQIITIILKNNESLLSNSLLKNAIYTILDTNITLKNDEEVIWAIWVSKVFNIKLAQNYIKQILDTENWLAIIILLDIISVRKSENAIKKMLNKFRERIISEYFSDIDPAKGMLTDIWLLAYEADKNKWLNTSGADTFAYACKHSFFKELLNLGVEFYNNNFNYDIIGSTDKKHSIYVTRKELINILKEYTKIFESQSEIENSQPAIVDVQEKFYEKIINTLESVDDY